MSFEYHAALGFVAVAIGVIGYIPYYRDIFRGTTKPHPFTWVGFGLLNGVTFVAQIVTGAGPGAWVSAITTIALTGSVGGTVYNWTRDNATVAGIAASGSGDISGSLTNTTNAPVFVTFTITPIANSCPGAIVTSTVLVNPTPDVAQPAGLEICNGSLAAPSPFTGLVAVTTYNWINNAPSIGLAASGTGIFYPLLQPMLQMHL